MKKFAYIILLIFSLTSINANANFAGKSLKTGFFIAAVAAAMILTAEEMSNLKSDLKDYQLSNKKDSLMDFLNNTKWGNIIDDLVRYHMSNTKSEQKYILLQKISDFANIQDIPPFQPEDTSGFVSDGLKEYKDRYGNKLETPANNIHYPWMLENPETKEKIDTRLEFPLESPKNWEEYLLLKSNSYELGKNMESAGQPRPNHSVAHHIVPATMKKSADAVKILDDFGIKVNDAENGVWLPQKGLDSKGNPSGAIGIVHSGVHPNVYATWVNDLIKNTPVNPNNKVQSKQNLEQTLESIRQKLINAQNNGKTWYDIMK